MLTPEEREGAVDEVVRPMVWAGFATDEEILDAATDYNHPSEPSEADVAALLEAIAEERADKAEAEATWPERTDVDRLIDAFDALEAAGVLALHNAGYTQSDAHEEAADVWRKEGEAASGFTGFVYYHGQDVERAMDGGGLYIGFSAFPGGATDALAVARQATDALRAEGLEVEAPASADRRILLPRLDWKNRSPV